MHIQLDIDAHGVKRLPMRKSAAIAAVSMECGFPNGAAELWTCGRKSAAIAAVSTECGFPNGAAELWTCGRKSAAERILWNYQRDYRQSLLWYQMDTDWPTSEQIMLFIPISLTESGRIPGAVAYGCEQGASVTCTGEYPGTWSGEKDWYKNF